MPVEFKLPELGENIVSGDVVRIMVGPGDLVQVDQPVIEVETGKAVVEVPSNVAGRVTAVLVREGETAKVGQPVLALDTEGSEATPAPSAPSSREAASATDVKDLPATRRESTDGPADGQLQSLAQPSAPLSREPGVVPGESVEPAPSTVVTVTTPEGEEERRPPVIAAPSVRQFAREIGVDIYSVAGSGPGGRISIEDVKKYAREQRQRATVLETTVAPQPPSAQPAAPVTPVVTTGPGATPLPDFSAFGPIDRQPMSAVRRATADHLSIAWREAPHVTQFDTADVTELEALRKRFQPRVEKAGAKLTVTAMIIKIVAAALKAFPQVNASVDMQTHEIVYKRYYHLGVAADTDRGLVVPVLRDVDRLSLVEIAKGLGDLSTRARERKLKPDEMQGGTFTITNLGGLGGKHFTPVLNWPEVGILGVGRAAIQPVYVGDELKPRLMLPLAFSYDHRVVDGADGTRFLRWLVEAMEDPILLILEG